MDLNKVFEHLVYELHTIQNNNFYFLNGIEGVLEILIRQPKRGVN